MQPSRIDAEGVAKNASPDPASTIDATGSLRSTAPPGDALPPPEAPMVPGYRIVGEIARGGMGRVYRAYDSALDREVAVKTLLPGGDGRRFEIEARIAAKLPHPGVPPVYALGTTTNGAPFLAMKLIRGRTLADILRERAAPTEDASRFVGVFEGIAQAVGFAHARGVVHRDLKPLNVMVGEFGEVQVMDWGLAKDLARADDGAFDVSESADPALTAVGAVMGTPGYMAPEQARGAPADARADVFALGAILAAILTGKPAFVGSSARETIEKSAAADLADVMARLHACAADGELAAIARHCLQGDPHHRPSDGRAVAEATAAYRAGVDARLRRAEAERAAAEVRAAEERKRRRQLSWAGGALGAVLCVGVAGTSLGFAQARGSALAEKAARQTTEKRLTQIEAGVDVFARILRGLNPRAALEGGPAVYEQLRKLAVEAADELRSENVADAEAEAHLQTVMGETLEALGDHEKAIEVLERARATRERELGLEHPNTLVTMNRLGRAYRAAGKASEALALQRRAYDGLRAEVGDDDVQTLVAGHDLAGLYSDSGQAEKAVALFESVRDAAARVMSSDRAFVFNNLNSLAVAYRAAGRDPQAMAVLERLREEQAKAVGEEHYDYLATLNNLAVGYRKAGESDKAAQLHRRVFDARTRALGPEHAMTLNSGNNLAMALVDARKTSEAIPIFERVLQARGRTLGEEHAETLTTANNLAVAYRAAGRKSDAVPLFERNYRATEKSLGADSPKTQTLANNLAFMQWEVGRRKEAVDLFEKTLESMRKNPGADHPSTLGLAYNLACIYAMSDRTSDAVALLEGTLAGFDRIGGRDTPTAMKAASRLSVEYLAANRPRDALPLLERAREAALRKFGADRPETLACECNLGACLAALGRHAEALPLFERAAQGYAKRGLRDELSLKALAHAANAYDAANDLAKGETWRRRLIAAARQKDAARRDVSTDLTALGANLVAQRRWSDAETPLTEALTMRDRAEPDGWRIHHTRSLLGAAQVGRKNVAVGEKNLLDAFRGLEARRSAAKKGKDLDEYMLAVRQARARLVEHYEAAGRKDEADKWRSDSSSAPPPTAKRT